MQIGSLRIPGQTVFAPLAGITNLPMRLLAKEAGCALVYTEMISAMGLANRSIKTHRLMNSVADEKPLAVQLFGTDPARVAEAARMAEAAGADIVDINFGCAVKKVVKTGAGVALMRTPTQAADLLQAVRAAIRVPLTIKLRSGWEPSGRQALELTRIAEDCGVDAVALHPRTARQGFGGRADWSLIGRLKRFSRLPVIGNGDITCAADALRLLRETGCDAVMVGRAAIGNPFIFEEIQAALTGRAPAPRSHARRVAIMRRYVRDSVCYLGEKQACRMLRSRLGWFSKGMPASSQFREAIKQLASEAEALAQIACYEARLQAEATRPAAGAAP
jgi:tRNA-dihydrouridine synthase B